MTKFQKEVSKILKQYTDMNFTMDNINKYYSILVQYSTYNMSKYIALYLELYTYYKSKDGSLTNFSFFQLLDDKWKNNIREVYL